MADLHSADPLSPFAPEMTRGAVIAPANEKETAQQEPPSEPPVLVPRSIEEFLPLFSHSAPMRVIAGMVKDIAGTDATVLIRGESGVGKDIVARAIHAASDRCHRPLVKVNCAALPAELLESELFGHEKGAFTGAYRRKLGQFEYAHHGTMFLDEIGDLPFALQGKLLHVLQDFAFSRIGGREIRVDTRVITSTNRDLERALARGDFREDLYYRLNVVEIRVPPLRERQDEIPALAEWFLEKFNKRHGRHKVLDSELTSMLLEHPWPGNVRELENTIQSLVVLSSDRHIRETLRARRGFGKPTPTLAESPRTSPASMDGLREIARWGAQQAERKALIEVLERVNWNRAEAARILKVSYKTLLNKISECKLTQERHGLSSQL